MILLVINTQKLITNENLYKFNEFVSNVEKIIATARQNNIVKNIKWSYVNILDTKSQTFFMLHF